MLPRSPERVRVCLTDEGVQILYMMITATPDVADTISGESRSLKAICYSRVQIRFR